MPEEREPSIKFTKGSSDSVPVTSSGINVIRVLYHRLMFHYNRLVICHSRLVIREFRKKNTAVFPILVSIIQWFSFFKFWRIFYLIHLKFQTDVPNNKSVMSIKFTHNIFFLLISILFPETYMFDVCLIFYCSYLIYFQI
jgi:hypothetical protein